MGVIPPFDNEVLFGNVVMLWQARQTRFSCSVMMWDTNVVTTALQLVPLQVLRSATTGTAQSYLLPTHPPMSAQLNINVKLQIINVVVMLCSLAVLVVFLLCSVKLQICNVTVRFRG